MIKPVNEFPNLTEKYKKKVHQEVLDSVTIYELTLIKRAVSYGAVFMMGFMTVAISMIFYFAEAPFIYMLPFMCIYGIACIQDHYLESPEIEQKISLTKKGVIITETFKRPEIFYKSMRYSGYFGIVIAIIGVIIAGPLILVGAGAGILIAFKMINVEKAPKVKVIPFLSGVSYLKYDFKSKLHNGMISRVIMPMIDYDLEYQKKMGDDFCYFGYRDFYALFYATNEEQQEDLSKQFGKVITLYDHKDVPDYKYLY